MKIAKVVGGVFLLLIVASLATLALLPKSTHVERSLEITSPIEQVYTTLVDLNAFKKWNPWVGIDPDAKLEVRGAGMGAEYEWQGEKSGHGKMTISSLEQNRRVTFKMEFLAPFQSEAIAYFNVEPAGAGTKVTWGYDQELPFGFMRLMGVAMDGMLGKDFEKGLGTLKSQIETSQAVSR